MTTLKSKQPSAVVRTVVKPTLPPNFGMEVTEVGYLEFVMAKTVICVITPTKNMQMTTFDGAK